MALMSARHLVTIGIGGASCSGKTLLAKHVQRVLPSSPQILHQDDFFPLEKDIPISPTHGVQDWDDPPTAILWDEFRSILQHIRETGEPPQAHQSHDHLNKLAEVSVDPKISEKWQARFLELGDKVKFSIIDGFILYWDKEVAANLDVRILMDVPREVLKKRREERQTYVLSNPTDAATGGVWEDPPLYFDQIVWPAYVMAHAHLYDAKGKIEEGITVLRPGDGDLTSAFESACEVILQHALSHR